MARVTKTDWTYFGLKQLGEHGHEALNALSLAKKLGVSRGSFYWHFEDIADFEACVLNLWEDRATEHIIRQLEKKPDAENRLVTLIEMALMPSDVERSVRSWSVSNEMVAQTVARIDERRFNYIKSMLADIGVEKSEIRYRALLLSWAGIGRTMILNEDYKSMSKPNVKRLVALMSS